MIWMSFHVELYSEKNLFGKGQKWTLLQRAKMDIAAGKNRPLCRQKWTLLQHMLFGKGKKWTSLD